MSHYTHFTTNEREKTMVLLAQGAGVRGIARELRRSPSSVSRELKRNTQKYKSYSAAHAARAYRWRRRKCRPKHKLADPERAAYVEERLRLKWSPEQIVGRAKREGYPLGVCCATIYRAVARRILPIALHKEMRLKRQHRIKKDCKTGKIQDVRTIHERPQAANRRLEHGHWESDTVHGKRGTGDIATHVERKTGYLIALKLKHRADKAFNIATQAAFSHLPDVLKKSFTVDRGPEFYAHDDLTQRTGMPVYFCDPGCPGQRGLNENTNGLLRQYFPKGSSFSALTQIDLENVVQRINQRPRKRFDFLSPEELFLHLLHLD